VLLGFVGAHCEGPLPLALSPSLTRSPFPPRLSSNRTCGFPASGSRTDFTWGIQRKRLCSSRTPSCKRSPPRRLRVVVAIQERGKREGAGCPCK